MYNLIYLELINIREKRRISNKLESISLKQRHMEPEELLTEQLPKKEKDS